MAYINKKDFSIVGYVQDQRLKENYFECDDLIAPAISLLNKKGYKTVFCCSGHPYATIDTCFSPDIPSQEDLGDSELLWYQDSDPEYADICEDTDLYPYYLVCKCHYGELFYIIFDEHYKFPELPGDAYRDEENGGIYWNHDMKATDDFSVMQKIFELNKEFYEWVEKLDSLV